MSEMVEDIYPEVAKSSKKEGQRRCEGANMARRVTNKVLELGMMVMLARPAKMEEAYEGPYSVADYDMKQKAYRLVDRRGKLLRRRVIREMIKVLEYREGKGEEERSLK